MDVKPGRRTFLRQVAAAGAFSAMPPVIRQALAVPADRVSGGIEDVQHVVILMQENRSFDHYFGTLNGVRGFGDRFPIPLAHGRTAWQQHNGRRVVLPYRLDQEAGNAQCTLDLPHSWPDAQLAWDFGRMAYWPRVKTDASMAYYSRQELPFHYALADAFTICDAYHSSLQGGTNPNRLFMFTGTNDPGSACGGPAIDNAKNGMGKPEDGYTWTTYAERLEQAGVSWKVYQDMADNYDDNPLVLFRQFRQAYIDGCGPLRDKGVSSTLGGASLQGLKDDVLAGRLPQVSWIVAPRLYCEHPAQSTPVQGGWYTQQVLEALMADPAVWSRTVFLLMYDENDAFFDHVPPPAAPTPLRGGGGAGKSTVDYNAECHGDGHLYGLGARVPMLIISPWSKGGWVNSQVFDHTSVLRFLELRFGVREPNISPWRRAVCGDLSSCFDFSLADAQPLALTPRSRDWADAVRSEQQLKVGIEVPAEVTQAMPQQAAGVRPSRALPYRLNVRADVRREQRAVALSFVNLGRAGAVFHVYDMQHLDWVPRRYTVEAGKQLDDVWTPQPADQGRYDLWVQGPNGLHRRFQGRVDAPSGWSVQMDDSGGQLVLVLSCNGDAPCSVALEMLAYTDRQPPPLQLAPGETRTVRWDLAPQRYWYDVSVSGDDIKHRYAGRAETGRHGVSDPAMATVGFAPHSG